MKAEQNSHLRGSVEDSAYVSITDMLTGLLFLFIIMLMYFAVQLRQTTETLITSDQSRAELVTRVSTYMAARGVPTNVDLEIGVLRLPDALLFERGSDIPRPEGEVALRILAEALDTHLPCYAYHREKPLPAECPTLPHHVETIFVEGHTDNDPIAPNPRLRDNWDLSASRASNTLRVILADNPALSGFISGTPDNPSSAALFSIAGYADQRPVEKSTEEAAKARNRRIDVRFIMAMPDSVADDSALLRDLSRVPPDLADGAVLDLSLQADTDAYLRNGWSWREDWGVWSVGPRADILLPLEPGLLGKELTLTFQGVAYVDASHPTQSVQVMANGINIGEWQFEHPDNFLDRTITIPPQVTTGTSGIVLQFVISKPSSPLSLGLSRDNRPLGIGIGKVEISGHD